MEWVRYDAVYDPATVKLPNGYPLLSCADVTTLPKDVLTRREISADEVLRLNIPGAVFPVVKAWPSDFNFGALFRDSKDVNTFFEKQLRKNRVTIIKSHLLPDESNIVANI